MRKLFNLFFTLLIVFSANNISAAQKTPDVNALRNYIEEARQLWKVPGMAVGIIYNDEIFLLEGFGEKEYGTGKKVDGNTVFAVASNTKAFTASALAMLVDEGKISWDDKVNKHLPWFKLYDPYVSENLTIRDLLCHRSGLVTFSGDLIWYGSNHSREEILRRASFLKPKHGFRSEYGYSNILYLAAGQIVEVVSGLKWEDFVKTRIFSPLGMNESHTTISTLNLKGNTALPHNDADEKIITISYLNWDNIGPAGSINSSAADMLKWLQLQLNEGIVNDNQLISKKNLNEMWSPQTIQKVSAFSQRNWPSTHFKSYGLGWALMDYHGKKVISHSGGYDGMISYSSFIPEAKLGFVILTNKNSSLYYPLAYKIMDTFLSDEDKDWSKIFHELITKNEEASKKEEAEKAAEKVSGTVPTLDLKSYCGTYTCDIYGNVEVELVDNKLNMRFVHTPIFHSTLEHWHFNTFTVKFPDVPSLPSGKAAFVIGMDNKVEKLLIDVPNPDFDFTELDLIKKE